MRALIAREARSLKMVFLPVLGLAVVVGAAESLLRPAHMRAGVSLLLCAMASVVGVWLAGARAFTRDGDEASLLHSLPVSRFRVWLAKLLGAAISSALLVTISFAACCGLLLAREGEVSILVLEVSSLPVGPAIAVAAASLSLVFALSFMASTFSRTSLRAMGGAVGLGLLCPLGYHIALHYGLQASWGPWLGIFAPDVPTPVHAAAGMVLAALAVAASGWGYTRAPALELTRRASRTIASFLVLVGAASALTLLGVLLVGPSLETIGAAWVDPSGRWIALLDGRLEHDLAPADSVWIGSAEGKNARLLTRGPVGAAAWARKGGRLFFHWGSATRVDRGASFVGDAPDWSPKRVSVVARYGLIRTHPWNGDSSISPSGRYLWDRPGILIELHQGGQKEVELPLPFGPNHLIGWSLDEETLFVAVYNYRGYESDLPGFAPLGTTRVEAVTLADGHRRVVATLDWNAGFSSSSPNGNWIVGSGRRRDESAKRRVAPLLLLDTKIGASQEFVELSTFPSQWSPDGRYLWCVSSASTKGAIQLRVLDTTTMTASDDLELAGQALLWRHFSPKGERVYLATAHPRSDPSKRTEDSWVAKTDGTGLRSLGKLSGRVIGWTHDGDLLVFDKSAGGSVARFNPDTRAERLLYRGSQP